MYIHEAGGLQSLPPIPAGCLMVAWFGWLAHCGTDAQGDDDGG